MFLQSCKLVKTDPKGSRLLCRMPALDLRGEFIERLMNSESGMIDNTRGSGVAVFYSTDARLRADIYLGLRLDGLAIYRNISSSHSDFKMLFALKPAILCQSDVVVFAPGEDDTITLQVHSILVIVVAVFETSLLFGKLRCQIHVFIRLFANIILHSKQLHSRSSKNVIVVSYYRSSKNISDANLGNVCHQYVEKTSET